jgi:hypothetical protein
VLTLITQVGPQVIARDGALIDRPGRSGPVTVRRQLLEHVVAEVAHAHREMLRPRGDVFLRQRSECSAQQISGEVVPEQPQCAGVDAAWILVAFMLS